MLSKFLHENDGESNSNENVQVTTLTPLIDGTKALNQGSESNVKTKTVVSTAKHQNNDIATAKVENDVKIVEKVMEKTETDKSEKTHSPNESSKEEPHGSLQRKGIANGLQKMSNDSKKDLVIVPKSIIDELSKKDESDSKLESLKNSIDGLRKMLQTVDNIPSKRNDDGISKGVESHEKQNRAPTKETEVTSKHHGNPFRLPTSGTVE
jgi:hypothetical protein